MKFEARRGRTTNDAGYSDECILLSWSHGSVRIVQPVFPEAPWRVLLYEARLLKQQFIKYLGAKL